MSDGINAVDLSSFPLLRLDELCRHDSSILTSSKEELSIMLSSSKDKENILIVQYATKLCKGIVKELEDRAAQERVNDLLAGKLIDSEGSLNYDRSHQLSVSDYEKINKPPVLRKNDETNSFHGKLRNLTTKNDKKLSSNKKIRTEKPKNIQEAPISLEDNKSKNLRKGLKIKSMDSPAFFVSGGRFNKGGMKQRTAAARQQLKARSYEAQESRNIERKKIERNMRKELAEQRLLERKNRKEKQQKLNKMRKERAQRKMVQEAQKLAITQKMKVAAERAKAKAYNDGKSMNEAAICAAAAASDILNLVPDIEELSDSGESLSDSVNEQFSCNDLSSSKPSSKEKDFLNLNYRMDSEDINEELTQSNIKQSTIFKTSSEGMKKTETLWNESTLDEHESLLFQSHPNCDGSDMNKDQCIYSLSNENSIHNTCNYNVLDSEHIKNKAIVNKRFCYESIEKSAQEALTLSHETKIEINTVSVMKSYSQSDIFFTSDEGFIEKKCDHSNFSSLNQLKKDFTNVNKSSVQSKECETQPFTSDVCDKNDSSNYAENLCVEEEPPELLQLLLSNETQTVVAPDKYLKEISFKYLKRNTSLPLDKGEGPQILEFAERYPDFSEIFTAYATKASNHQNFLSRRNSLKRNIGSKKNRDVDDWIRYQIKVIDTFETIMEDSCVITSSQLDSTNLDDILLDCYSQLYFRVGSSRSDVFGIINDTLAANGNDSIWKELPAELCLGSSWNLLWTWSKPKVNYRSLLIFQKINHFQNSKFLTRKDLLKKKIHFAKKATRHDKDFFNIMPDSYILPQEYNAFVEAFMNQQKNLNDKKKNFWILKPTGLSRGRGISLVNDIGEVSYADSIIMQYYIRNPLLIEGYKFDLRLYVLVTSFNPLEAFIYREGFARFASKLYSEDPSLVNDERVHLTNSSIQRSYYNDLSENHPVKLAKMEGGGNKTSLSWLWNYLENKDINTSLLWDSLCDICLKTLICSEDEISFQPNAFEVYGFDVMFDEFKRPWLIEVNSSPSMSRETNLDKRTKELMIQDTISLVDPPALDRIALKQICKYRLNKRSITHAVLKSKKTEKEALDNDLRRILRNKLPRKYGEKPAREKLGNYKRIAPGTKLFCTLKSMKSKRDSLL